MKRWICKLLLPVVSRLENKMWREVYARKPRKKDWFDEFMKHTMPCKDMFRNLK